jgi:hypothetical protein
LNTGKDFRADWLTLNTIRPERRVVFGDALNILFSRRARDEYNSPPKRFLVYRLNGEVHYKGPSPLVGLLLLDRLVPNQLRKI